ncbi:hypothetical protein J6590_065242 [Homalodisca vitripennis]|nr:hypothetical protein J6590_065242 [Homalodisca vitripennis]
MMENEEENSNIVEEEMINNICNTIQNDEDEDYIKQSADELSLSKVIINNSDYIEEISVKEQSALQHFDIAEEIDKIPFNDQKTKDENTELTLFSNYKNTAKENATSEQSTDSSCVDYKEYPDSIKKEQADENEKASLALHTSSPRPSSFPPFNKCLQDCTLHIPFLFYQARVPHKTYCRNLHSCHGHHHVPCW